MATMFPTPLPAAVTADAGREAERRVYDALARLLDPEHAVFYSVAWLTRATGPAARDGEADFVIAHSDLGVLVLEVKGGQVGHDQMHGRVAQHRPPRPPPSHPRPLRPGHVVAPRAGSEAQGTPGHPPLLHPHRSWRGVPRFGEPAPSAHAQRGAGHHGVRRGPGPHRRVRAADVRLLGRQHGPGAGPGAGIRAGGDRPARPALRAAALARRNHQGRRPRTAAPDGGPVPRARPSSRASGAWRCRAAPARARRCSRWRRRGAWRRRGWRSC